MDYSTIKKINDMKWDMDHSIVPRVEELERKLKAATDRVEELEKKLSRPVTKKRIDHGNQG